MVESWSRPGIEVRLVQMWKLKPTPLPVFIIIKFRMICKTFRNPFQGFILLNKKTYFFVYSVPNGIPAGPSAWYQVPSLADPEPNFGAVDGQLCCWTLSAARVRFDESTHTITTIYLYPYVVMSLGFLSYLLLGLLTQFLN